MEPEKPARYREIQTEDTAGALALLGEIMALHGVRPPSEADLHAIVECIIDSPDHTYIVAVDGGAIVALCALIFTMSTWSAERVCELQDIVVRHDRRRQGIGRGLLAAAVDFARTRGCVRVFLTAETFNLDAHAFYRSVGLNEKAVLYFEATCEHEPPPGDSPENTSRSHEPGPPTSD